LIFVSFLAGENSGEDALLPLELARRRLCRLHGRLPLFAWRLISGLSLLFGNGGATGGSGSTISSFVGLQLWTCEPLGFGLDFRRDGNSLLGSPFLLGVWEASHPHSPRKCHCLT
jgi:hypothetical protein